MVAENGVGAVEGHGDRVIGPGRDPSRGRPADVIRLSQSSERETDTPNR